MISPKIQSLLSIKMTLAVMNPFQYRIHTSQASYIYHFIWFSKSE
ncbi:hypothetical protein [Enterococcus rivorum]|nr:hypothetical protein [Enterococcus rivorum]